MELNTHYTKASLPYCHKPGESEMGVWCYVSISTVVAIIVRNDLKCANSVSLKQANIYIIESAIFYAMVIKDKKETR